jgi:hypothetical protein
MQQQPGSCTLASQGSANPRPAAAGSPPARGGTRIVLRAARMAVTPLQTVCLQRLEAERDSERARRSGDREP